MIPTYTSTGCDILCAYCGRPVIGDKVVGASGFYHPECVKPPRYDTQPTYPQKLDCPFCGREVPQP